MRFRQITLVAALVFVATSASVRAAPVVAGPQATAADIRAAHGTTTALRRLVFADTTASDTKELNLELGADYLFADKADRGDLFDFKLRRHIVVQSDKQTFANSSLFAEMAFRAYEFQNRQMLAKVLGGAGINGKVMSQIDNEAQIGLTLPSAPQLKLDVATDGDGIMRFSYEGKELAHVRFDAARFTAAEQQAFGRFLRHGLILHPAIATAVTADGRVPAELSFVQWRGFESAQRTLTLKSNTAAQGDFPLPANYAAAQLTLQPGDPETLRELPALAREAIAGRASGGPRSVADYRKSVEEAFAKGNYLQANVTLLELSLHHGVATTLCPPNTGASCHVLPDMLRAGAADDDLKNLAQALSYEGRNAVQGVPLLRKIDRSRLTNAYVLDIFLANDLGNSPEALALFVSGIRGNPYVAPFYKDFGLYLQRRLRFADAWMLYDLGRSLPNAKETPMLDAVDTLEQRLANDFPQYF